MRPETGDEVKPVESHGEDGKSASDAVEQLNSAELEEERTEDLDPETELRNQLNEMELQAAEYLEGWQRARAEFANAKKRLEKQRSAAYQNAASDFAAKMLPLLDDFGRAIESVPQEIESDGWYEGIGVIVDEIQVGYRLGERVIRPSLVNVAA